MCRIVGFIKRDKTLAPRETVINMRDALSHGGPDDSGIYEQGNIIFAHRRLSIIDLSKFGHQPMLSEDRKLCLSYNGEIYNFKSIKSKLIEKGYTFQSTSDTEVILKGYQEFGEDIFSQLSGMYALSLYDKNNDCIYLARDHCGIKPLYYHISDNELIFSSEVKAFKHAGIIEENTDWKIYFLLFGFIPEPYTTLKDVLMLPKASYLKLNLQTNNYTIEKYETASFKNKIITQEKALSVVKNSIENAIESHLISDAPIGVFLSGGIDSSLISIIASRFKGKSLKTLSIIFDEKQYSEEKYQNSVVNQIQSDHSFHTISEKDFSENLQDIFRAMDQPTIDGVNTYFISKCAHERGLKAVLSGLGGDELFGGYPSFRRIEKLWYLRILQGSPLPKIFQFLKKEKFKKLSFLSLKNPLAYYLILRGILSISSVAKILERKEENIYESLEKLFIKNSIPKDKKNIVSLLEKDIYMQGQLLRDSDVMSMWHSLEIRVPFLDKQLIKHAFSIDPKIKFINNQPKYLITKPFENILPYDLIHRKKQGFTFPFDLWLKQRGEAIIGKEIQNRYIAQMWKKFQQGNIHWSRFWALVVMKKFGQ